ncbi:MAG: hypothetical protein J7K53_06535 [Bacteroidales bacterium]|nr:hypothetical protein [Bacteroidales bacterium]
MVVLQGMFSQAFGQVASKTKETDSIIPIISNDMSIQSTTLDSLGNRYKFYEEVLNETHALLDSLIVIQNKNYLIFDTTISKTYKLIEENKELANSKYLDLIILQKSIADSISTNIEHIKSEIVVLNNNREIALINMKKLEEDVSKQVKHIENKVRYRSLILLIFALISATVILIGWIVIRSKINKLSTDLVRSLSFNKDFNKILGDLDNLKRNKNNHGDDSKEDIVKNSSLIIKVGEEIFRMKIRILNMEKEAKGVGALQNSIQRLEYELNSLGFYLSDLTGQDYNEGLTVIVKGWEIREDINPGEQKILRMIKPQMLYNGEVVGVGEIVVGTSPKDS